MEMFACPPPQPEVFPLDHELGVGFGYCGVTRNGVTVWIENQRDAAPTLQRFEDQALTEGGEWVLTIAGPMSGATFTRQGPGRWVMTASDDGFA